MTNKEPSLEGSLLHCTENVYHKNIIPTQMRMGK